MFQASLRFDDLKSPLDIVDGGIFLGRSSIVPLPHRMLHTRILESDAQVAIMTCERFNDSPQGIEREERVSDAVLRAEIEAMADYLLDFAILIVDRHRRAVRYEASPVVTAPAYLWPDRAGVAIDWDYARLLRGRRIEAVPAVVLAHIAGFSSYRTETIVAGLYRATAGAVLTVTPDGASARLPQAVVHDGAYEIAVGADIEGRLFDTVSTILAARPLAPAVTAVELSGGMDSALTALAAAEVAGPGLLSIGAQFGGAMGAAQGERRRMLRARGRFDDLSVPAERFAAFAPGGPRRLRYAVLPDDENYPELFEALFALLKTGGFDTLVSGFGGDELYPTYEGEDAARASQPPLACPFLIGRGAAIAQQARSRYPAGWLQESCWQSAAGRSQRLLRHGIWPIYPYLNVPLARFVSRLPRAYRRDRSLLRKTLTRITGDPVFETDYVKEAFGPVARRGIEENRAYLIDLVRRSPLARLPEIDTPAILAALDGEIVAIERMTFEALFRVLKVFAFFQSDDVAETGEAPAAASPVQA